MRLEVRTRTGKLSRRLAQQAQRRLRFALARFGHRVSRVIALLSDQNGPRGGIDQHCRITLALTPGGKLVTEATDIDMLAAVGRAADRMARRVRDAIDRRRTLRVRTHRPLPNKRHELAWP